MGTRTSAMLREDVMIGKRETMIAGVEEMIDVEVMTTGAVTRTMTDRDAETTTIDVVAEKRMTVVGVTMTAEVAGMKMIDVAEEITIAEGVAEVAEVHPAVKTEQSERRNAR